MEEHGAKAFRGREGEKERERGEGGEEGIKKEEREARVWSAESGGGERAGG